MKIPVLNKDTRILCQGITSTIGAEHTELAIAFGANIVGGVSRDSKLTHFLDVPVFPTVRDAVRKTKPEVSVIFSSPFRVYADVEEAVKARIPVIICTTEKVPYHDTLKMKALAERYHVCLIGPSAPGIVTPDGFLVGTIPGHLFPEGHIGIVSRSSSLTYEVVQQLATAGCGVSKCFAIGSPRLICTPFVPLVDHLLADKNTKAILLIGMANGPFEEDVAQFLQKKRVKKPIFAYLPGSSIHAEPKASVLGDARLPIAERIARKQTALKKAGVTVITDLHKIGRQIVAGTKPKKG